MFCSPGAMCLVCLWYDIRTVSYSCLLFIVSLTSYAYDHSLSRRSILSRLFSASSASFAEVFTPSPDFCVFSMIAHARRTKAGTVSCFSCLGISTKVQYWVSRRITSCRHRSHNYPLNPSFKITLKILFLLIPWILVVHWAAWEIPWLFLEPEGSLSCDVWVSHSGAPCLLG